MNERAYINSGPMKLLHVCKRAVAFSVNATMVLYSTVVMLLLAGGWFCTLNAQINKGCIAEVKRLSGTYGDENDSLVQHKTMVLKYTVKSKDWDDVSSVSNVTVYRNAHHLHFFSEQAVVYQDTDEVVMVVPLQKVAFLASTHKRLQEIKLSPVFYEFKDAFLDSCEVLSCETGADSIKTVVLKAGMADVAGSKIKKLTYRYDVVRQRMVSSSAEYAEEYKLKELSITYKELKPAPAYTFTKCRYYFLDKTGKPLAKYRDYEFEDTREKVSYKKTNK